jgi:glycosyltransferase involved in cell wall biosynthesis
MNIAIVAPSSVPFVMGGAENLWLGLQRYINEETNHHCELFKIPTLEGNLTELLNSYRTYSQMDLSSYDRVITGKYPAWMIQHRSHAVYMLHTLRGLYDTYHFCKQPLDFEYDSQELSSLRQMMFELELNSNSNNADLQALFDYLERLLSTGAIDSHQARFPGPLARDIIHFLDRFALRSTRIALYSAISGTVIKRADYFPSGVEIEKLYPPPRLTGFQCKSDNYLFTSSRLDGPKRIALLVQAMQHTEADIQLLIGGTGPDEARLKELAAGNPRIVFLGYLTDAQLLEHYANALVVLFVPYDEDYGLIAIEAMKSSKPVITTTDAGGVTELVVHGETGLVVAPDPQELARAIDHLCMNREVAKQMGRNARIKVESISWANVGEGLLRRSIQRSNPKPPTVSARDQCKSKMVVAVTFPIYPPRGGGQSRIFNLYREWARHFDITIVSLTGCNEPAFTSEIATGLVEIRIPKTLAHQNIEDDFSSSVGWLPVTDIAVSSAIHATPDYLERLKTACADADIVVASHPYLVRPLREFAPECPLWFEAQDVEFVLKKQMLPKSEAAKKLLDLVMADESMAWHKADVVYACTLRDLDELASIYGTTSALTLEVPNGFAIDEVQFTMPAARKRIKQAVGLDGSPTVIFMGSWHGPNIEAVEKIIAYAEALPSLTFLIIGSVGLKFTTAETPQNIVFIGVVDEREKQIFLAAADLAINPMTSGSGSNLKMFDYFAAGVPVLSTVFGTRGINIKKNVHCLLATEADFILELSLFFLNFNSHSVGIICKNAASLMSTTYSWKSIATDAYTKISLNQQKTTLKKMV